MAGRDNSKNKIPAWSSDVKMKKRGRPPKSHRGRGRPPSSPSPSGVRGGYSPSPSSSGFRGCSPSPSPSPVSNVEWGFLLVKLYRAHHHCSKDEHLIFQNLICLVVDMQTGTGTDLVPHQLTVNVGENLIDKVATFAKSSSQTVCILSCVGSISSVVFRKPGFPSTDTVTWEGRFDILSLSGNYTFVPGQDNVYDGGHNCWNLTISDCHGTVFGGSVVGPMIVATPVYLILGTFKLGSVEKITSGPECATAPTSGPACATAPTSGPACATAPTSGPACSTAPTSEPLLIPKTEYQESESLTTPKTADKTSECVTTPNTADKTSESVTTPKATDEPTENVTSTTEKVPGEDPKGEGEKQSVTPKITDKPQEELSSETVDKPPENVTPSTSDKPPENVTPSTSDKPPEDVTPAMINRPENVSPATTRKSPENVVASTSDTSLPASI
ncbi:hypothetical protein V8G54_025367 [Vigna mungo]|uniref:AT-hook motif nuclear-localized protein n=1 Tax=Vigna mungo TaxID=3915 RepID=A0AAQ3RN99_VIGMU